MTVGLAEMIWHPLEKGAVKDNEKVIRVYYDESFKVTCFEDIQSPEPNKK